MNEERRRQCRTIIHTAAAGAAAGNAIPLPGLGLAADMAALTGMTMKLASVFGGSLAEEAAKGLAVTTLKQAVLRQPIKLLAKELSKALPIIGSLVAPAIAVTIVEATGWAIANELDRKLG